MYTYVSMYVIVLLAGATSGGEDCADVATPCALSTLVCINVNTHVLSMCLCMYDLFDGICVRRIVYLFIHFTYGHA